MIFDVFDEKDYRISNSQNANFLISELIGKLLFGSPDTHFKFNLSFANVFSKIIKMQNLFSWWIKNDRYIIFTWNYDRATFMKVQKRRKIYRLQIKKDSKLMPNNRGKKTYRTIKTKLPLQFCMNGLTIIISQLVLS